MLTSTCPRMVRTRLALNVGAPWPGLLPSLGLSFLLCGGGGGHLTSMVSSPGAMKLV